MAGQFVYTIVTMAPSTIWLYDSKVLSVLWILTFFSVSVWNGASFYFKVMANYKEVAALKKELDDLQKVANGTKTPGSTVSSPSTNLGDVPSDMQLGPSVVDASAAPSPLMQPTTAPSSSGQDSQGSSSPEKVPLLNLDKDDEDRQPGGQRGREPSLSESDSSAVVVEAEDGKESSTEQKKDV